MRKEVSAPFDWSLWFQWLMATTWGWFLGESLFPGIARAAVGIAVGIFQWLVLYRRVNKAWRWILASGMGWLAGWLIELVMLPAELDFLSGILIGGGIGSAQWLILRLEVDWAFWWIPISILAWVTGLTILPGIFLTGMMVGVLTGVALELLLRSPKSNKAPW